MFQPMPQNTSLLVRWLYNTVVDLNSIKVLVPDPDCVKIKTPTVIEERPARGVFFSDNYPTYVIE